MKNHILNLGKILTKTQQKQINGGDFNPCPCSSEYELYSDGSCSYSASGTSWGAPFPGGRCLGTLQNDFCCV
ncbi:MULTISPECIES: hypothetical protein [Aquimarina]|uniref:hypothetical protein n=1 Tax=Aquimarina TaxID=290174 RepID=UPI000464600E|nr:MULTISPECIES: hypothetical protein [Aquimarina]PKV49976.1 hypothetical protein ATE84_2022 [Aquimarina sp. MAR_2010_214]